MTLIAKAHLTESLSAWGYTISSDHGHFIPSTEATDVQPFRVHIFGARKEGVVIPEELLGHVLVFHSGLDYVDYYRELSQVVSRWLLFTVSLPESLAFQDLVLPILGSEEYTRNRATAAFPAGIISRVPSLVTPSLLKAYSYLEPPAIVLHPDGTDEVEVLAAMRRGEDPWTGVKVRESVSASQPRGQYTHSPLFDRHLRERADARHKEGDWDGYVADVAAYNANLLCKALLR